MKKMSVYTSIALVFAMLICMLMSAQANEQATIELYINKKQITTDVNPRIINDRTMVPVRVVMENFGADVKWDGVLRMVSIETKENNIQLTIDSNIANVDGKRIKLDVSPIIVADRTLVPIRFVSENLGYNVNWDGDKRIVSIDAPEKDKIIINSIDCVSNEECTVITVETEAHVIPEIIRLKEPHRIVMDLPETHINDGDGKKKGDGVFVKEIRWAQHDNYSRFVIETVEHQDYTLGIKDEKIILTTGEVSDDELETEEDIKTDLKDEPTDNKDNNKNENKNEQIDENVLAANMHKFIEDGKPLKVVIDAGHGGRDSGAVVENEDGEVILHEKDIALDMVLRVEQLLKEKGVDVILTREDDIYLGKDTKDNLLKRCKVANDANAALFVSIHTNSFADAEANGTEICYTSSSGGLFGMKSLDVAKKILSPLISATGLKNRGTMDRPRLAVLKYTSMPAVLLELGFISNPGDREVLLNEDKAVEISEAIADSIEECLKIMQKNREKTLNN